jgi:hypothetical protein
LHFHPDVYLILALQQRKSQVGGYYFSGSTSFNILRGVSATDGTPQSSEILFFFDRYLTQIFKKSSKKITAPPLLICENFGFSEKSLHPVQTFSTSGHPWPCPSLYFEMNKNMKKYSYSITTSTKHAFLYE